jgi:hypothetical protein
MSMRSIRIPAWRSFITPTRRTIGDMFALPKDISADPDRGFALHSAPIRSISRLKK